MKAYERFLRYVVVPTPSDESSETQPSSPCQFNLARILEAEMDVLGLSDVCLDDQCYLYGKLPATPGYEDKPALGFIAHMDTVDVFCDRPVRPVITPNYDGKDFPLGNEIALTTEVFKHLPSLKGRTLITTDGYTILGADDKAGIAEILTLVERLIKEDIPHGPICIAFTPDEEIGTGADGFNLEQFGADFAYTMDGDTEGEIQYENFNACRAKFTIEGSSVHPGEAKDTMVNAALLAIEINSLLPGAEIPRETEGYEGFYHLIKIKGDCSDAALDYIIRDHDKESFEARKATLRQIQKFMNEKWGSHRVKLDIHDEYQNMNVIIKDNMHLIENAKKAAVRAGLEPLVHPIRGGTDGCQLSFKGLPCPNLGTGGHAFHGLYEHITVEGMDLAVDMAIEIVKLYAE